MTVANQWLNLSCGCLVSYITGHVCEKGEACAYGCRGDQWEKWQADFDSAITTSTARRISDGGDGNDYHGGLACSDYAPHIAEFIAGRCPFKAAADFVEQARA